MKKTFTFIALFFSITLFSQYSVTNTTTVFVGFDESLGVFKERILKNGDWWQEELDKVGRTGMTVSKTSCEIEKIKVFGFGAGETEHKSTFVVVNEGTSDIEKGDAFKINVNGKIFQFSLEDAKIQGNEKSVQYGAMLEDKGYRAELVIPWTEVDIEVDTAKQYVDFEIELKEGTEGITANWMKEGRIYLDHEKIGNNYDNHTSIPLLPKNYTIKVDGFNEFAIANGKSASVKIGKANQETGFRGWWTAAYDKNNLYVWLRVIDKTKQQGNKIEVHLSGATSTTFKAYRKIKKEQESKYIGLFQVKNGMLFYDAPYGSITTFREK